MVVKISVKHDLPQLAAALKAQNRKVEVAAQRALLKTARIVKDVERAEMAKVFDRPTRWTLNSFEVVIDKADWSARVQVKDGYWHRADNYLNTQIMGGGRRDKAFEIALRRRGILGDGWYAVPGQKAAIDSYGNMSVGQIKQILSWFDSAEPFGSRGGSTQNMGQKGRDKKRKGTRTKRGFEYFVASPAHRQTRRVLKSQPLEPGIYKRTWFSFLGVRGGRLSAIEPIVIFVSRSKYGRRFDFYGVGRKAVDQNFGREYAAAFNREAGR